MDDEFAPFVIERRTASNTTLGGLLVKLVGEYRFQLPREKVWEALLDADVLCRCLPGFEKLEKIGDNEFEGALQLRVGPVQGQFRGGLSLSNLEAPVGYDLTMKGQGPAGFVNGTGSLSLADDDGGTLLGYDLDTQIGGKIAGVGQRLLESSAKALSDQALSEFGKIVERRAGGEDRANGERIAEGPSQAEFVAKVAKGVAEDLVPPERRALLVTAGLAAVVVIIVILFRSCGS